MSSETSIPPSVSKRSKLFIASLSLNLLVVGLFAGTFLARHRWGRPPDFGIGKIIGESGLRGFLRTLPKERREALRSGSDAHQLFKPLRQAVQQARQDVVSAMNAIPLEPTRVEKSMNDLIAAEATARRASAAILVEGIIHMTSQERTQFQDWRKKHEYAPPPSSSEAESREPRPAQAPMTPSQR